MLYWPVSVIHIVELAASGVAPPDPRITKVSPSASHHLIRSIASHAPHSLLEVADFIDFRINYAAALSIYPYLIPLPLSRIPSYSVATHSSRILYTARMVHPDVDETPLTASPIERRNSLEKHLQSRPDQQDLKDRHILLNTNVAPYVAVAVYPALPSILPQPGPRSVELREQLSIYVE